MADYRTAPTAPTKEAPPQDADKLTKREWFAGMALTGILGSRNAPPLPDPDVAAVRAVAFGDAVLKLLEALEAKP